MSEQAAEPTSGEQGSLSADVSHSAPNAPAADVADEPSATAASAFEAPKPEANAKASEPEAAKPEISHVPGKVIVMPRGDRAWTDHDIHSEPQSAEHQSVFGKRRVAAMAAVLALATAAGAVGGALATASLMHGSNDVAVNASQGPLEASLSRIDADIQTLKTGLDHTSKLGMNQFNKTSDRVERLERAQAEPAAKLAKLSDAVEKLRAAAPTAAPVVAAVASTPAVVAVPKETTGSIAPAPVQPAASGSAAPKADMKTEFGRLPTLEDWVLRDVGYGGAVIGSRRGTYEVYAGDMVPGLGRVDAIRRQDGRWVVVTSRGLIVAR
jgi:hypothetical protein